MFDRWGAGSGWEWLARPATAPPRCRPRHRQTLPVRPTPPDGLRNLNRLRRRRAVSLQIEEAHRILDRSEVPKHPFESLMLAIRLHRIPYEES